MGDQSWRDIRGARNKAFLGPVGAENSKGRALRCPPAAPKTLCLAETPRSPPPTQIPPAHPRPPRVCPAPAQPRGTLTIMAPLPLGKEPGVTVQPQPGDSSSSLWGGATPRCVQTMVGTSQLLPCTGLGTSCPEKRGCLEHLRLGSNSQGHPGSAIWGCWLRSPAPSEGKQTEVMPGSVSSHPSEGCVERGSLVTRPGKEGHSAASLPP